MATADISGPKTVPSLKNRPWNALDMTLSYMLPTNDDDLMEAMVRSVGFLEGQKWLAGEINPDVRKLLAMLRDKLPEWVTFLDVVVSKLAVQEQVSLETSKFPSWICAHEPPHGAVGMVGMKSLTDSCDCKGWRVADHLSYPKKVWDNASCMAKAETIAKVLPGQIPKSFPTWRLALGSGLISVIFVGYFWMLWKYCLWRWCIFHL